MSQKIITLPGNGIKKVHACDERGRPICGARNRQGLPCQCKKLFKSGRCKFHGGLSTGPKYPR
jgi:hypothetical protein